MALFNRAIAQAKAWRAYAHLGDRDAERDRAIVDLCQIGAPARPALNRGLTQRNPRIQFGAAIALHRMGDSEGLDLLVSTLRWKLGVAPELAPELEAALVRIGSPDAVKALLGVWAQITDWSALNPVPATICRVWTAIRDPLPISALIDRARETPTLFLETIPELGHAALAQLERMLRDSDSGQRILAVQAIGRIPHGGGFAIVMPMLSDPHPAIRAEAAAALANLGSPSSVVTAITEAILAGWSSGAALNILQALGASDLYSAAAAIVVRCDPRTAAEGGDSRDAVIAALRVVGESPERARESVAAICSLICRRPDAPILVAAAEAVARIGPHDGTDLGQTREAMLPMLAHVDSKVRARTTAALGALGDAIGREFTDIVERSRPQRGLVELVQMVLRSDVDKSELTTEAVRRLARWLARASRAAAEQMTVVAGSNTDESADPRVLGLIARMLTNALDALSSQQSGEEIEEVVSLAVASLRALRRARQSAAPLAREPVLRALHIVPEAPMQNLGRSDDTGSLGTIGAIIRMEAAETVAALYGPASYALFVEAAFSGAIAARETAIAALGKLADVRCLPLLNSIATHSDHGLAAAARQALALFRRRNPEIATLLRPSAWSEAPETLLRAAGASGAPSPNTLLRPEVDPGANVGAG